MSLASGTRLGPYEITAQIGAGGMGEVYKARDTRLERTVAIKILPESLAADPPFRERFDREARAISQLTHPHICTLYDVGEQSGTAFLVMEYLDGETLADRLKKGALPLAEALTTAIAIASALDTAHRAGITHRDLKPGNVMLTKAGAKLLDFGLAKTTVGAGAAAGLSMLPTTPPGLTAQGTILGTFQYMAPEQLEGQDADTRTDIFAFGAVLYEMLTGQKAFAGKSQASLIGAIMHAEPTPIVASQPLAPPILDRVVTKCLAKQADERWQSAKDLHDELKWVAASAGEAAVAARSSTRSWNLPKWALLAMAMVAIAALALAVTPYFRGVPEPLVTRLDVVTPPTPVPLSFALSADGRQLVFVADGAKGPQLWLRPLDQGTAQPMAGTDDATNPFWSPDGRAIGFFAEGKLKRLDLQGGMQVLAEAPANTGAAWGRDGVIVFGPNATSGLLRVAAAGGTPTEATRLVAGQVSHRVPHFLPDGRHFLFSSTLGRADTRGVYIGSLEGAEPRRILAVETEASYAAPGYLLWVSQGSLMVRRFDPERGTFSGEPVAVTQSVAQPLTLTSGVVVRSGFSVSDAGVLAHRSGTQLQRQLVWVDRSGKTLSVVRAPDDSALATVEIRPDGEQAGVLRVVQGNGDVWLIELKNGIASRFTYDPAFDASAVWSPNAAQVVFASNRHGRYDLFEKPANGATDERPLLVTDQDKMPLAWSPDGKILLYAMQDPQTQTDLWALPMEGDRKPFPVVRTSFDDVHGQFSPDGQWIAYASNETGRYEIYVGPFPEAGGKHQISAGGGIYPRWRHDGRELFYVTLDNRLMAVPIQVTERHTLNPGAESVLFTTRMRISGNVGIGGVLSRALYAVASDGRFLMITTPESAAVPPITIVQNWTAALKERVATR